MFNNLSSEQNNASPKAGTKALLWFRFSTVIWQIFRLWHKCCKDSSSTSSHEYFTNSIRRQQKIYKDSGYLPLRFLRYCIKVHLILLLWWNNDVPGMFSYTKSFDISLRIIIIQWKFRIFQKSFKVCLLISAIIHGFLEFKASVCFVLLDFQLRKISIDKKLNRSLSVIQSLFCRWFLVHVVQMIHGIDLFYCFRSYDLCRCHRFSFFTDFTISANFLGACAQQPAIWMVSLFFISVWYGWYLSMISVPLYPERYFSITAPFRPPIYSYSNSGCASFQHGEEHPHIFFGMFQHEKWHFITMDMVWFENLCFHPVINEAKIIFT